MSGTTTVTLQSKREKCLTKLDDSWSKKFGGTMSEADEFPLFSSGEKTQEGKSENGKMHCSSFTEEGAQASLL